MNRAPSPDPSRPAEVIFTGGMVRTMEPAMPEARAVAVRQGTIVYVGDEDGAGAYRGAATRVVRLDGAALFPGFIDAHAHVAGLGKALRQVRLEAARSAADAARMVAEWGRAHRSGWIEGRGWDQNDWPGAAFPHWRDLEGAAGVPVALRRVDGHALWANRAALSIAGIGAGTPDPPGGRIVRDGEGEATGVLIDTAMDLVVAHIPRAPEDELVARLRTAMTAMSAAGLTGAMDAGVDARGIEAWRAYAGRHALDARIDVFLSDDAPLLESWWSRGPEHDAADGCLSIRGVKMFSDGALGSRGAAMLAPYSDDPGNDGLILATREHMLEVARRSLAAGFDVAIHAIGDRANRLVLDVFEEAKRAAGLAGRPAWSAPVCRVEHAQILAPEDLGRFGALGVVASMQPIHATADMSWAGSRVGPERIRFAYAWRSLLRSGAALAFGSDFPIEDHRPLLGIHAAVTRQDVDARPAGGWLPEERLTALEAVRGFTIDAARAAGAGAERGSIAPGKRADLVVLSRDLLDMPPEEIPSVEVLLTMTAGRVVYER